MFWALSSPKLILASFGIPFAFCDIRNRFPGGGQHFAVHQHFTLRRCPHIVLVWVCIRKSLANSVSFMNTWICAVCLHSGFAAFSCTSLGGGPFTLMLFIWANDNAMILSSYGYCYMPFTGWQWHIHLVLCPRGTFWFFACNIFHSKLFLRHWACFIFKWVSIERRSTWNQLLWFETTHPYPDGFLCVQTPAPSLAILQAESQQRNASDGNDAEPQ